MSSYQEVSGNPIPLENVTKLPPCWNCEKFVSGLSTHVPAASMPQLGKEGGAAGGIIGLFGPVPGGPVLQLDLSEQHLLLRP